jgi:hypothetical protein
MQTHTQYSITKSNPNKNPGQVKGEKGREEGKKNKIETSKIHSLSSPAPARWCASRYIGGRTALLDR